MKKVLIPAAFLGFFAFAACNDNAGDAKDSPEKADSANEAKAADSTPQTIATDEATTDFLVKAADGGLAEVEAGKMGQEKSGNDAVKEFAGMMVNDHTGANAEVKKLAAERNVTLPTAPGDNHKKDAEDVAKKTGKDFDKAYMKMMVSDHKKTIDLFEKAQKDSKDEQVKAFISSTLPKLKMHLEAAQKISDGLK
jgi:putative membrane protein